MHWQRRQVGSTFAASGGHVLAANATRVFVASGFTEIRDPPVARLIALDRRTGATEWQLPRNRPVFIQALWSDVLIINEQYHEILGLDARSGDPTLESRSCERWSSGYGAKASVVVEDSLIVGGLGERRRQHEPAGSAEPQPVQRNGKLADHTRRRHGSELAEAACRRWRRRLPVDADVSRQCTWQRCARCPRATVRWRGPCRWVGDRGSMPVVRSRKPAVFTFPARPRSSPSNHSLDLSGGGMPESSQRNLRRPSVHDP